MDSGDDRHLYVARVTSAQSTLSYRDSSDGLTLLTLCGHFGGPVWYLGLGSCGKWICRELLGPDRRLTQHPSVNLEIRNVDLEMLC